MKYISQFLIILSFTLAGEALQRMFPLPIPASVYGLVLLFTALCLKVVQLEQVRQAGTFLTSVLSLLFVSPTVNIVDNWGLIRQDLLSILLLLSASTALTFGISGRLAQFFLKGGADR